MRNHYVEDTPLVPLENADIGTGASASTSAAGATAKTRSRPSNEYVLYAYGEPVAMTADGNTLYFGTDILGSVRNVTDKYGNVQSNYNYDVFGALYLSNLDHDMSFGYCGKAYDNGTGLYNYGFRDYSPNQARFTTIDPIRDGSNWFSYVVNDPVNYIDPFGLTSTDSGSGKPTNTNPANNNAPNEPSTGANDSPSTPADTGTPTQPAPTAPAPEAPAPEASAPTVPTPSSSAPPVSTGGAPAAPDYNSWNTEPSGWDYDSVMNYVSQGNIPGQYGAPTDSRRVTSPMCYRDDADPQNHTGIDIGALKPGVKGDPIYAVADGVVTRVGISNQEKGTTRLEQSLPHTKDTAVYMHADFIVKDGESVKKGQIIGYMSDNGSEGQVHLHFEIRKNGIYVNEAALAKNPLNHLPSSYYIE